MELLPKRLLIARHAEADFSTVHDFDRPLSRRGEKSTHEARQWLADQSFTSEHILCSPAQRTRETYQGVFAQCGEITVDFLPSLYNATGEKILEEASLLPPTVETAMIFCHQPGVNTVREILTHTPFLHHPALGISVYSFLGPWNELFTHSHVKLIDFFQPTIS